MTSQTRMSPSTDEAIMPSACHCSQHRYVAQRGLIVAGVWMCGSVVWQLSSGDLLWWYIKKLLDFGSFFFNFLSMSVKRGTLLIPCNGKLSVFSFATDRDGDTDVSRGGSSTDGGNAHGVCISN